MSVMIEQIKEALTKARKTKNKDVAFLATLHAEIINVGKNNGNRSTTNEEALKVIKKMYDTAQEVKKLAKNRPEAVAKADHEIAILQQFLPKQLSEQELKTIIQQIINEKHIDGKKAMGAVMKILKDQYNGQYDGKLASQIVKQCVG